MIIESLSMLWLYTGGGDSDGDLPPPPEGKPRRRSSSSTDSLLVGRQLTPVSAVNSANLPAPISLQTITPIKMGVARGQLVTGACNQTQKVIIVSGAGSGASLPKTYLGASAKSVVTATTSAASLISHVKPAWPSGSGSALIGANTPALSTGQLLSSMHFSKLWIFYLNVLSPFHWSCQKELLVIELSLPCIHSWPRVNLDC